MTANLLQAMFEAHQPSVWFFGHHHVRLNEVHDGTRFQCLPELGSFDMQSNMGEK
jgi:hypothetical protein